MPWIPNTQITGAGGGVSTVFVPLDLRNPQQASNAGNSFPNVTTLTDWEEWHWEFVIDVVGKVYGIVPVPRNLSESGNPKIVLDLLWNATSGVSTMGVACKAVGEGESLNPGALTSESDIDVSIPATARLLTRTTFPASGTLSETLAAGDLLIVEITHNGAAGNDTAAVNTELVAAYLQVDIA